VEDDLLLQAQPAAAVLLGPADAAPAVGGHVLVPLQAFLEGFVLAPRAAQSAQCGELADEVCFKPSPEFLTKRVIFRRIIQIHDISLTLDIHWSLG